MLSILTRQPFICIPVPGENYWVQHGDLHCDEVLEKVLDSVAVVPTPSLKRPLEVSSPGQFFSTL
jgi:hypothetical protein